VNLNAGGRVLRWLGSWRALAVVAGVALVVGFFAVQEARARVEAGLLVQAVQKGSLIEALTVNRNMSVADHELIDLTPVQRADIDADVQALKDDHGVAGLEVWHADGRLLYRDPDLAETRHRMPPDEQARARQGRPFVQHQNARDGRPEMLEVFLPYDPNDDGNREGQVEIHYRHDEMRAAIAAASRLIYLGAGVLTVLLLLGLIGLRRRHRATEQAACRDQLTGLGNRRMLTRRGNQLLTRDLDGAAALLLLDLDGYKRINDTLGRSVGDQVLVAVAAALRGACRSTDLVVRLGGDEFAVLLAGLPNGAGADRLAEHVREAVRRPITAAGLAIELDANIGVALAPEHGSDISTLLRCADLALWQATRRGTEIAVYDGAPDPRETQQITLLAELRRAITDGELRLYYQPKASTAGRVRDVEALVRWQHPERGLLPPAAFLPLVEQTSLIRPLTTWVLHEAARQCARWAGAGIQLEVAVNVSPRNLSDDQLPATVLDAATAAGIPVTMLQVEITETAVMSDPAQAEAVLARLHGMGVTVAIDDFGAGYTSLAQLQTLPVGTLKIDRRFITNLVDNTVDEAVVRNVVNLAHDLGMSCLAEGVEDPPTWAKLADLGCDQIQGYVLTPPLPPDQLADWLADWNASRQHLPQHDAPTVS
jgi:diguanylate cyclase (GGDEF)-like protein